MATKLVKISTRAVIVMLMATIINIAIFFTWIATGPRSIPFLSNHIERALNKTSPGYRIKIGQAVFVWDNWSLPLAVHVKNVKLFDKDAAPLANFPEVKIGLSISHLLIGDMVVRDLGVSSPRFHVALSEKTNPVPGQKDNILPDLIPVVKHLSNVLQKSTSLTFENVNIQQATIVFDTGHQELPWFIEEAYIELSPSKTRPEFNIEARTLLAQYPIFFTASGKLVDLDTIELILGTKGFPSKILSDFLPQHSWLQNVNLELDISVDAALNTAQGLKNANYHITSKKGALALETQGWLKNHAQHNGVYNVPEAAFIARLSNLPFDDLWRYWRPGFADNPRKWMSEHMQGGTVTQATLNFTATPDVFLGDAFAPEAISANVTIKDVEVAYHPDLPLLEDTTGTALFTGNSMDLVIEKATLLNSQLTSNVVITGLSQEKQSMTINGHMSGPLADLSHFYALRKGDATKKGNSITAENLTGDAETNFFLEFPLLNTLAVDDVTLAINGELQNVTLPNATKNMDLTEGTLTLMVDNTTLSAEGGAKLNGAPITLTYIEDTQEKFDSQIQLDATLAPVDLARFGAKGVEVTGLLKVSGTIENIGTTTHATTTINATSAGLTLPILGWKKQHNLPLKITLAIHDTADAHTLALRDIAVTGQDVDIKGNLTLKKERLSIVDGTLSPFKLDKHDLAIAIASKDTIPTYTLTGAQMNAEPVIDYLSKSEEENEKKEASTRNPLHIKTDISTVLLANDVQLQDVKGFLECGTKRCHQAGLLGKFAPEEDVFIDLKSNDKTRTFFLKTTNAGSFFRGLGLLKHINGGTFETTATMDDGAAPSGAPPAKGSFIMKDFRIKKAPILTKLLTLLSFTGILDLLEGEGIFFKKAGGSYTLDLPTLTVQEVKASGNSLGLTVDGEANLGTSDVLLRGNVVPAYSLNTIIEGIPFIGEMITGGEGEGIVAARYKISGKYQDPEITVNPLSILTPGFLRNIWGDTAVPEPNPELDMQQPRPE